MYVIDHMNGMYEFYRGSFLVYRGQLHNLYMRLRRESTGGGEEFYDIEFSGYGVRNMYQHHKMIFETCGSGTFAWSKWIKLEIMKQA